MGMVD